jgi:predicted ATPase
MKTYLITGGPGSGKSSIILALELMGEYVVREAAEDYIKTIQAYGISNPWDHPDFQLGILKLSRQRESRIPKAARRVFLDRSMPDGLAYEPKDTQVYAEIANQAKSCSYDLVFLVELLGTTDTNAVRREDRQEAIALEARLIEIYQEMGYKPIHIKPDKLKCRVGEILFSVNSLEASL